GSVLSGPAGNLGRDADHPAGQDYTLTFFVSGAEGLAGSAGDDSPDTAHQLQVDPASPAVLQVAGTIGDDLTGAPGFDSNDVDYYHFRVTGPDRYVFVADAFAGRFGSPLDVALSLFREDGSGDLQVVAGNNDTGNPTNATAGPIGQPLSGDAVVFAG